MSKTQKNNGDTAGTGRDGRHIQSKIYDTIYDAITKGRIPPGTKLVEEQLSDVFVVSRGRIRNVLQELARDKVVTLQLNRGAFVSEPDVQEAKNVFAARKYLEPALARDVIRTLDQRGIERLRSHIKKETVAERNADRRREIKISQDFHLLLAKAVGNDVITEILEGLLARSALITAIYDRQDAKRCSHVSHSHLIDLIESGDATALATAMYAHIDEIESELALVDRRHATVDVRSELMSLWR